MQANLLQQRLVLPRSTPELQGISSAGISKFLTAIKESGQEFHSLMILRHGHVVPEAWWSPYSSEHRQQLYSLSKSFTGTAIGLAVAEGLLSVEDPIIKFYPELLWDRFSRNAGDAYQMINMLRKLGVEPQAIEQPLDLAVPENKLMLAFYLAAPEVENDRRALNVLMGMRKAKKEGRYMGPAPLGYANKITEDGKKYIAPKEPDASIIKWVFETIAAGQLNVEQVMKAAFKKGVKCCKANFWHLLRNPVYCGRIYLCGYKDEVSRHVQGLHQPIISEALFYDVQDYLNGKKKMYRTKVGGMDTLHLRGHLICPKCGKILTGSASKGRNGKYYYYHCISSCGTRFKAENANDLFSKELKKLIPRPGVIEIYKLVIQEEFKSTTKSQRADVKLVKEALEKASNELANARRLLLANEIEPSEYRLIKSDYEKKITGLESKLMDLSKESNNIEPLLNKAITTLTSLHKLYENANNENKREIIGSIFPEKLTFDGFHYRTARLNEAVRLIYSTDKGFSENKNGQTEAIFDLSNAVTLAALSSNFLVVDLQKIIEFKL